MIMSAITMNMNEQHILYRPEKLPFLEAVCWDLHNINLLTDDEALNHYERGWCYKDVLADLSGEEEAFMAHLAKTKGSWLQTRV